MISERDVIYITKKQASIAIVALATFCILLFMLGYFWGKQCVLDSFGQRITQESMNDQADYESIMQSFTDRIKSDVPDSSLLDNSESDSSSNVNLGEAQKSDFPDIHEQFAAVSELTAPVESVVKPLVDKNKSVKISSDKKANKTTVATTPKKWSAVLVGFATKQSALSFVQRLQNRGISVQIKTRISKSATGKTKKMWFQVVTNSYNSKEELDEVIAQIKKTERIKSSDIKIN